MNKLKKILAQWSSMRGTVVVIASVAGLNPVVTGAGLELIDTLVTNVLPIAASGFGLFDVLRDEKKER